MNLGVGIDTGGTYTDAVIYDYDSGSLLAKVKTITTKDDFSICVGKALDLLPQDLLSRCSRFNLSTTLATNACVENKGSRAKLIIMGTNKNTMSWIEADKAYGLRSEDVLCIETSSSFDGKTVDMPDWETLCDENDQWLSDADAFAVAEVYGTRNGGICELEGCRYLNERYGVPAVASVSLSNGLNVMERGATAMLNARLITIIDEYIAAVKKAAEDRNITATQMTVRSDGSLMGTEYLMSNPVSAILSGPAASVRGSRALADEKCCLIMDMGGTTTDIALVKNGKPIMRDGIKIGNFRTQVRGVLVETVGLGGDSRIRMTDDGFIIDSRKVEPMCMLLSRCPELKERLKKICDEAPICTVPMYEALYLVKTPTETAGYTPKELQLIEILKEGPVFLGEGRFDLYNLKCDRLEAEGIIMRSGMTPTDFMHIGGDFTVFDIEASKLAAGYMMRQMKTPDNEADQSDGLLKMKDTVYELISSKLYEVALEMLIKNSYPKFASGLSDQLSYLIRNSWKTRNEPKQNFELGFITDIPIVGVGAPIHVFLPSVAEALGVECIIPENAEVANAVGSAVAGIEALVVFEISYGYEQEAYTVRGLNTCTTYSSYEDALEKAKQEAALLAVESAKQRGAVGDISVEFFINKHKAVSKYGFDVYLGTTVEAVACNSL